MSGQGVAYLSAQQNSSAEGLLRRFAHRSDWYRQIAGQRFGGPWGTQYEPPAHRERFPHGPPRTPVTRDDGHDGVPIRWDARGHEALARPLRTLLAQSRNEDLLAHLESLTTTRAIGSRVVDRRNKVV